jgi:hypothetical protein
MHTLHFVLAQVARLRVDDDLPYETETHDLHPQNQEQEAQQEHLTRDDGT